MCVHLSAWLLFSLTLPSDNLFFFKHHHIYRRIKHFTICIQNATRILCTTVLLVENNRKHNALLSKWKKWWQLKRKLFVYFGGASMSFVCLAFIWSDFSKKKLLLCMWWYTVKVSTGLQTETQKYRTLRGISGMLGKIRYQDFQVIFWNSNFFQNNFKKSTQIPMIWFRRNSGIATQIGVGFRPKNSTRLRRLVNSLDVWLFK